MKQVIEFDVTKQLDQFNKLASSMPYIISRAINEIAFKRARIAVSKSLNTDFNNTDKYFNSANAIRVLKSSKQDLKVTLYHFKEQLSLQQFGGTEKGSGHKLAIPIRANFAKYAGVPTNKKIPKSLSIDTIMKKSSSRGGYRAKGVMPYVNKKGVYIRTTDGLRLLYVFKSSAEHKNKLLKFQEIIEATYNTNLERFINREYLKALKG